jgi:hypothetical protein
MATVFRAFGGHLNLKREQSSQISFLVTCFYLIDNSTFCFPTLCYVPKKLIAGIRCKTPANLMLWFNGGYPV